MLAARYHSVELDPADHRNAAGETQPTTVSVAAWAKNAGMWSRAARVRWSDLLRVQDGGPIVLLLNGGGAVLMVGANSGDRVVYLTSPGAQVGTPPTAVDELRLAQAWSGHAVLIRAARTDLSSNAQFNFGWVARAVMQERRSMRDIALASFAVSVLTIFPPLLVMATVNRVLQYQSVSTLILLSSIMVVVFAYETMLGYARRLIISVIGTRLDAKLSLHIFERLLRLPLDYFEHNPVGQTLYKMNQIYRIREFLTGKLLSTLLDLVTLCILMPVLFFLQPILASIVLVCAALIALIIFAYLKPLRTLYLKILIAENWKSAALSETVVGIRTVKSLALEPARQSLWDERIAEAGKARLEFGRLANWPQTLVNPLERLMVLGTIMFGAYLAINDTSGYMVGSLFAFMMLSQRVAAPLVGLARLIEDYEEVGAAVGEVASVLNRPFETEAPSGGIRPQLAGAISFQDVTFQYAGTRTPALEKVTFSIPAGAILGVVGRSGSGKSTIARLLQAINRDYSGFIKIDGSDLREINLRHLRQSLGVVLQDNFLFRGSVRDNIIAGRSGLTLADAINAARLAGADEFIECLPNGYETQLEESSSNLSGGQRQRLAIARALIHDPRILILDEATSSLDPESEAIVTTNLHRIASGRTMILVSHRLASLVAADSILVLDQGKVVDFAPHAVLLERCHIYRHLWQQQNQHLDAHMRRAGGTPAVLVPSSLNSEA
jgi:ATP-binding cassette subfamily B protein